MPEKPAQTMRSYSWRYIVIGAQIFYLSALAACMTIVAVEGTSIAIDLIRGGGWVTVDRRLCLKIAVDVEAIAACKENRRSIWGH